MVSILAVSDVLLAARYAVDNRLPLLPLLLQAVVLTRDRLVFGALHLLLVLVLRRRPEHVLVSC